MVATAMSFTGKVQNGVVVLPPGVRLADGTEVEVTPVGGQAAANAFLDGMLALAKPRDWPEDFALNHGHYVKGHPKRS
jgi:hypothetical protein